MIWGWLGTLLFVVLVAGAIFNEAVRDWVKQLEAKINPPDGPPPSHPEGPTLIYKTRAGTMMEYPTWNQPTD